MKEQSGVSMEPTIFLSKKLWRFAEGLHGQIVLYLILFIFCNGFLLAAPLIFGLMIGEIQEHGVSLSNLRYLLSLLFLLFLKDFAFWIFHGPARLMERTVAFTTALNYRRYLLKGLLELGLSWHSEHDSGNTIDKVNKAGEGVSEFGQNIFQIVQILVKMVGTSIILLWFSPWIGSLVFGLMAISFVVIFEFDKRLWPQYRGLNKFSNKASAAIFDSLSNITTVKILHIESPILEGVIARFHEPFHLYRKNAALNEWKWFTGNMIFQVIGLAPIALYLYYGAATGSTLDAGKISTLYLYLADLIFVFYGFGTFYEQLGIFKNQVLNAEAIERAFSSQSKRKRTLAAPWSEIKVRNLSFSYGNSTEALILQNIFFEFKRGERIALIGESGSGKSTFLKVIHGMYPAARGSIRFSDIDLKTMLVPQEPEIFSSTIRENLTLGISRDEHQIAHAIHMAAFDTVLAQLPKGLDSIVNEKGVNLSGGQKQRLALSRALLFSAEKEILLLDESTSSVDSENEMKIYKNIWAAFRGKTIIASIHKMNLLKLFDRIVIFEQGKIVNEGTFDGLLATSASFRASWENFVATNSE